MSSVQYAQQDQSIPKSSNPDNIPAITIGQSLDVQGLDMTTDNVGNDNAGKKLQRKSWFSKKVGNVQDNVHGFFREYSGRIRLGVYVIMLMSYFVYFGYCMYHRFGDEGSIVLIVITVFLLWKLVFKILDSRGIDVGLPKSFTSFIVSKHGKRLRTAVRHLAYIAAFVAIATYLAVDVFSRHRTSLQSTLGLLVLVLLCFVFSADPSLVNWHPVFWSFAIQFALAFFTLKTKFGRDVFDWLGDLVETLLGFSDDGSTLIIGKDFQKWGLALSTSGVVIFTNAFLTLMNHWGVVEFLILKLGGFLSFCLETGPVESVVASANIFISMAEAPLVVRPYLPSVTKSEIHTIMTCGFASISGGLLGLFIILGAPAKSLLTASVISAPAALGISKLLYPETETVCLKSQKNIRMVDKTQKRNGLTAFSDGALVGVNICVAAWSIMLVFVSMVSLLDALVGWFGDRAGVDDLSFTMICSYVLSPLAYAMGVEFSDCRKVGELIGIKLFSTPVVGYQQLGFIIKNRKNLEVYKSSYNDSLWSWQGDDIFLSATNITLKGGVLTERSEVIATYAMCGYSAFTAIGITLGVLIPICPTRKDDILELIFRAFIAGNVASFATGAIAGRLFTK